MWTMGLSLLRALEILREEGPKSKIMLAAALAIRLVPMWAFGIVTMVAAQVNKYMLAALGSLTKGMGSALEMVVKKAFESDRLWADPWSNERPLCGHLKR